MHEEDRYPTVFRKCQRRWLRIRSESALPQLLDLAQVPPVGPRHTGFASVAVESLRRCRRASWRARSCRTSSTTTRAGSRWPARASTYYSSCVATQELYWFVLGLSRCRKRQTRPMPMPGTPTPETCSADLSTLWSGVRLSRSSRQRFTRGNVTLSSEIGSPRIPSPM